MNVNSRCFVASQILLRGNFSAPQKAPSVKRYQVCLKLANIPQGFIGASPFWGMYGKGACHRCQSDLILTRPPTNPTNSCTTFCFVCQPRAARGWTVCEALTGCSETQEELLFPSSLSLFFSRPEQINGWPCPLLALPPLTISRVFTTLQSDPRHFCDLKTFDQMEEEWCIT